MRYFNVTGVCNPAKHYMVDMTKRLDAMEIMIKNGDYFCINRGRQYGKTTTLALLRDKLKSQYMVFSLSFEGFGGSDYESLENFLSSFVKNLRRKFKYSKDPSMKDVQPMIENIAQKERISAIDFKDFISDLCDLSRLPIVVLIDEVDQAGNYAAFLQFLGILREMYLERDEIPTFQSVILASVYDIKSLKLKLRPKGHHQYNSPWNIAADFSIDMSFSPMDIACMLRDYEADKNTGMDILAISSMIFDYTSGYPYLVCKLCKITDEILAGQENTRFCTLRKAWSHEGILEAVKLLLQDSNTLFDDMSKKIQDFPELRKMLYEMLYQGVSITYNRYEAAMSIGIMFDFIKNQNGKLAVSNRIFETWMYNLFLSEEQMDAKIYLEGSKDKNQFLINGHLDMKKILERFVNHFTELFGKRDEKFIENEGRKYFLFYLKPIINGVGNYYIEARTRNEGRTDVIVDYLGKQYIIELKIWRGRSYHERGERQLLDYLDSYGSDTGYLLSFCFNQNKQIGVKEITINGKHIIEAVV